MNNIESMYAVNTDEEVFAKGYFDYLSQILKKMDMEKIGKVIKIFKDARVRNSNIFFIGNGGSASTASHFANDLSLGTKLSEQQFRAISLCDNMSVLTAIGNDYGYEKIFLKQLEIFMHQDDVIVAISASGNSPNLLEAIRFANKNSGITVGLTGFDGGELINMVQEAIHVPSLKGEYGPVEDVHMIIDHLISSYLKHACMSS